MLVEVILHLILVVLVDPLREEVIHLGEGEVRIKHLKYFLCETYYM